MAIEFTIRIERTKRDSQTVTVRLTDEQYNGSMTHDDLHNMALAAASESMWADDEPMHHRFHEMKREAVAD